jgi:hypothetical protein
MDNMKGGSYVYSHGIEHFSNFFYSSTTSEHLMELEAGVDRGFVCEKEGQNRNVQKMRVKSPLDSIVGEKSPISLDYIMMIGM